MRFAFRMLFICDLKRDQLPKLWKIAIYFSGKNGEKRNERNLPSSYLFIYMGQVCFFFHSKTHILKKVLMVFTSMEERCVSNLIKYEWSLSGYFILLKRLLCVVNIICCLVVSKCGDSYKFLNWLSRLVKSADTFQT